MAMNKRVIFFSICSSIYILIFLTFNNFNYSSYPWILFCIPPLAIWPLAVSFPGRFGRIVPASILAAVVSAYYIILNIFLSNGFPWSFFVAFALAWYPCSLGFSRRPFALSIFGFAWAVLFFMSLNAITTPYEIWAIYPIFGVLWWPLSVYFFRAKGNNTR